MIPRSQGIIDISVGLGPKTILMDSEDGMGDFRYLEASIDDGDIFNGSMLKDFTAHAGMHHALPASQAISIQAFLSVQHQHEASRLSLSG